MSKKDWNPLAEEKFKRPPPNWIDVVMLLTIIIIFVTFASMDISD